MKTSMRWYRRVRSRPRSGTETLAACVLCFGAAGCDGSSDKPPLPKAEPGSTVSIPAQRVTSGFADGALRKDDALPAFTISRVPVTVGEYRRCVAAGLCPEPPAGACFEPITQSPVERPNFELDGVGDDVAVTCVGVQGAVDYCRWVGGRLATLPEWFLAARGSSPQRFSWGNGGATCTQHGRARPATETCGANDYQGRVAQHGEGASAFGVEDVLLTPGELLATSPTALFPACRRAADPVADAGAGGLEVAQSAERNGEGRDRPRACVVYGLEPGAIDSVRQLPTYEGREARSPVTYGFRCTWGNEGQGDRS
jgi:hypothetical protein